MPVEPESTSSSQEPDPNAPVKFEHPRGTMAVVMIFGVLFGAGWLAMYLFRFLAMGAPHH